MHCVCNRFSICKLTIFLTVLRPKTEDLSLSQTSLVAKKCGYCRTSFETFGQKVRLMQCLNLWCDVWHKCQLCNLKREFWCLQIYQKANEIYKNLCPSLQGIPIVTLYSYLSILVGKISTVFLQILEYLLTDKGFKWLDWLIFIHRLPEISCIFQANTFDFNQFTHLLYGEVQWNFWPQSQHTITLF